MSKTLVQKALYLLQDVEGPEKLNKKNKGKSLKSRKEGKQTKMQTQSGGMKNRAVKQIYSGILKGSVDRTQENLQILEQLRCLKPKTAVTQKVIEFYSKRNDIVEEPLDKTEPKSILFDDDIKEKKKRKRISQ